MSETSTGWGGWTVADFRRHVPWIIAERDELRAELERCEGDLAVAIREATRAREALRAAQPFVEIAECRVGVQFERKQDALGLIFAALDKRLATQ